MLKAVWEILTFRGRIGRWWYLLAVIAALGVQYGAYAWAWTLTPHAQDVPLAQGLIWPQAFSWNGIPDGAKSSPFIRGTGAMAVLAASLWGCWMMGALGLARARDGKISSGLAALTLLPVIQWIGVLFLMFGDIKFLNADGDPSTGPPSLRMTAAAQGAFAGAGLSIFSVAVGGMIYGSYGYTLFLLSPFLIGALTAYFVGSSREVRSDPELSPLTIPINDKYLGDTLKAVLGALVLGALGLMGTALEGAICIVLAFPLALGLAGGGMVFGILAAQLTRRPIRATLGAMIILPFAFTGESALPTTSHWINAQSVEVDAPPAAVWRALVEMGPIPGAPAFPFNLGLAYPVDGRIIGGGVGAIRIGQFSTGPALERVTAWEPDRRLAFVVLSDPPSLRELSPWPEVHAPHVRGYFRTGDADFRIEALPGGRSRLTLTTHHSLDLAPGFYWGPIARLSVRANKARVLGHFRHRAEGFE